MTRKQLVLTITLAALAITGITTWPQMTPWITRWCIQSYCTRILGTDLHYDRLYMSDKQLVLTRPSFSVDGYSMQADEVRVNYHPDWLEQRLQGLVTLVRPQLVIDKHSRTLFRNLDSVQSIPGLTLDLDWRVEDGVALWPHEEVKAQFSFEHRMLSITMPTGQLSVNFRQERTDILLTHLLCHDLGLLYDLCMPRSEWRPMEGTLEGAFFVTQDGNIIIDSAKRIELHDLLLIHKDLPLRISLKSGALESQSNTGMCEWTLDKCSMILGDDHAAIESSQGTLKLRLDGPELTYLQATPQAENWKIEWEKGKAIQGEISLPWILLPETLHEITRDKDVKLIGSIAEKDSLLYLNGEIRVTSANTLSVPARFNFTMPFSGMHEWARQPFQIPVGIMGGSIQLRGIPLRALTGYDCRGKVDCDAVLTKNAVDVLFDLSKASLDTNAFYLEMEAEPRASLHHDLLNGVTSVHLLAHDGKFLDKKLGIAVDDIKAVVDLAEKQLVLANLEGTIQGISLEGSALFKFISDPLQIQEFVVSLDTAQGRVSAVKELVAHFSPDGLLQQLPIEGNVDLNPQGAFFTLSSRNGILEVSAQASGMVSDGHITADIGDLTVQEICCGFSYTYPADTLKITDLQGSALISTSGRLLEEYHIASDEILFTNYTRNEANFDVWIGDKSRDIVRLAGRTATTHDPEVLDIIFHKGLTHFSDVHPTQILLTLRNWTQIEQWAMHFPVSLDTTLNDIQALSRTRILPLDQHLLEQIERVDTAGGTIDVRLAFAHDTGIFSYDLKGSDVLIGDAYYKDTQLRGTVREDHWVVDQAQADDWSLSADISKLPGVWKVHFLGVQYGKVILAGLSGEYLPLRGIIDGQIQLLKLDLGHLQNVQGFDIAALQGEFKGLGSLRGEVLKGRQSIRWHAEARGALRQVVIDDLKLEDVLDLTLYLGKDNQIMTNAFHTTITAQDDLKTPVSVGSITYQPQSQTFSIQHIAFQSPALWPDVLPPSLAREVTGDVTMNLVKGGALEMTGSLNYADIGIGMTLNRPSKNSDSIRVELEDANSGSMVAILDKTHTIRSLNGRLLGLDVTLENDGSTILHGQVGIDWRKASQLLPKELADTITSWKLGSGMVLDGAWNITSDLIAFDGEILGNSCELHGCLLDSVTAKATIDSNTITLTNIRVDDPAIQLTAEKLHIFRPADEQWKFSLTHLVANEVQPTKLRRVDGLKMRGKTGLKFPLASLDSLEGTLGDSLSYKGSGQIEFLYRSKKRLTTIINALSQDLIKRLGADAELLSPSSGTVVYEVRDGKVVLKDLQNVFSDGKLTKFSLVADGPESTIDFDSNLNLFIKIKQGRQLFKMIDRTTMAIDGTLTNPRITLNP